MKGQPADIQDTQANNLFLPTWAMMTANSRPGSGSLRYAFSGILEKATTMIELGTPVELVIETHPNIAALFDEDQYRNSGIVSKWAASMVHGFMLKGKLVPSDVNINLVPMSAMGHIPPVGPFPHAVANMHRE